MLEKLFRIQPYKVLLVCLLIYAVIALVFPFLRYQQEKAACEKRIYKFAQNVASSLSVLLGDTFKVPSEKQTRLAAFVQRLNLDAICITDAEKNTILSFPEGVLPDMEIYRGGFFFNPEEVERFEFPYGENGEYTLTVFLTPVNVLPEYMYPSLFRYHLLIFTVLLLLIPFLFLYWSVLKTGKRMLNEKQKQLVHAGRLTSMGEMAAGIAHEINQPLCVIRGYLELIQMQLKDNETIRENNLENAFSISLKCADRTSRIVNGMRNFVRVSDAELEPVQLEEPLESALSFFTEQLKQHNIVFRKTLKLPVPPVLISPQQFEQIVVNLLANARYAVDERAKTAGKIYVKQIDLVFSYDEAHKTVVLKVVDNGIGMSKEVLAICGETFFTTKKAGEGTGLGVSIIKEILAGAKGTLQIHSEENKGSTFLVSLPAVLN